MDILEWSRYKVPYLLYKYVVSKLKQEYRIGLEGDVLDPPKIEFMDRSTNSFPYWPRGKKWAFSLFYSALDDSVGPLNPTFLFLYIV